MACSIINNLQQVSDQKLKKFQLENWKILKKFYTWAKFRKTIRKIVLTKNINKDIIYTKKELFFFKKNYLASPNYHLNFDMILTIIKSNIKIFIKRMFKLQ